MQTSLSMNRLAQLLVLVLCLPLTARADDASHRAKAQQMVESLHTDRQVEQVTANILKQISQASAQVAGPSPSPENLAKLAYFQKEASRLIDAELGWKAMEPSFVDYYAKAFSEEELDVILAFYKTPAGASLIEKMPGINAQIEQLGQSKMTELRPQISKLFADFQKEFQKAPAPAATTPTPAPTTAPAPASAPKAATPTPSKSTTK